MSSLSKIIQLGIGSGGHPLVNESRLCYFPFLHRPKIPTYSSDLEYNYGLAYQKLPYSPIGYKKEEYHCMFLGNEKDCFHFAIYFLARIWECVQLEQERRKQYLEEHGTNSYSHNPESNPFASRIVCGSCNKVFSRKGRRSRTGVDRKVWQCSERYKVIELWDVVTAMWTRKHWLKHTCWLGMHYWKIG